MLDYFEYREFWKCQPEKRLRDRIANKKCILNTGNDDEGYVKEENIGKLRYLKVGKCGKY